MQPSSCVDALRSLRELVKFSEHVFTGDALYLVSPGPLVSTLLLLQRTGFGMFKWRSCALASRKTSNTFVHLLIQ